MKISKSFNGFAYPSMGLLLLLAFSYAGATATENASLPTEWPISAPEAQGMRSHVLAEMMGHIRTKSLHIHSLAIVRNGHLVLDAYLYPFTKEYQHNIYSCTKSVMSALIGIAIDKGYIQSVNQPITDFFPDMTIANMDERKQAMTLENLLTMTSGFKCEDSYLYRWEGLIRLRFSDDWAQFVLDLPMAAPPGQRFEYCNGVSYLLSVIIQQTTKMRTLAFARKHLFDPLGIDDIDWETSPQEVDVGWGRMRLKPHDMAKFGLLYLNKGRWIDQQIVPAAWVEASTRGHIRAYPFDHYGYQWWIDDAGYYMAVGYKGQRIFVVPVKNLVAVFTGDLTGAESLMAQKLLDDYIIPAASSDTALPANEVDYAWLKAHLARLAQQPPEAITWMAEKEGVAIDGVFSRAASPAFEFQYPFGSKKAGIEYAGQIMRMKTIGGIDFSAFVDDIPEGVELKAFGPTIYARQLSKIGSKIEVVSHNEITLACGTRAYRTEIKWLWKEFMPIMTMLISAYKEDKLVLVSAHPSWNDYTYMTEPIVENLRFHQKCAKK